MASGSTVSNLCNGTSRKFAYLAGIRPPALQLLTEGSVSGAAAGSAPGEAVS